MYKTLILKKNILDIKVNNNVDKCQEFEN